MNQRATPSSPEELALQHARAAEQASEDLKWIASDKRGRRFIAGVLGDAGVNRASFNTNALTMAFNEGSRNVGTKLLARVLEVCPDEYLNLLKEFND